MRKQDKINEYNSKNKDYNITNTKTISQDSLDYMRVNDDKSLYEKYDKPSYLKIDSWNEILQTYKPQEIISVQGSHFAYSVYLIAENGDILHITKSNNYLVKVK